MREIDDLVVQGLYEAAAGTVPWKTALNSLDDAIGNVIGSQIVVVDKATGHLLLSEQPDHTPSDAVLEYIREYHRHDPHVPFVARRSIGEAVHTEEVFPPSEYEDHIFYREFWRPYNVRSFVGAKITEDDRCVSVIGVMRALDVPRYSQEEVQVAGRYFRHLAAAMRISKFLAKVRSVALVGYGLMEESQRPMVLIDRDMSIVAANTAARRFISEGTTLFVRNEVLRCAAPENCRALSDALLMILGEQRSQGARISNRTGVRLRNRHSGDVICSLWRLAPEETMGAFGTNTLALLTIATLQRGFCADPVLLASMFDLTPAEARVALAILDGENPTNIAKRHQVTVATIRSQLNSLFAKTSTHRQAELVRLLLSTFSM